MQGVCSSSSKSICDDFWVLILSLLTFICHCCTTGPVQLYGWNTWCSFCHGKILSRDPCSREKFLLWNPIWPQKISKEVNKNQHLSTVRHDNFLLPRYKIWLESHFAISGGTDKIVLSIAKPPPTAASEKPRAESKVAMIAVTSSNRAGDASSKKAVYELTKLQPNFLVFTDPSRDCLNFFYAAWNHAG